MKRLIYALLILLALAHQDFWWWDDADTLVFGFMPVGLAYHAGMCMAAAALWALAVRYCWPHGVDALDDPNAMHPHSVGGSGTLHSGAGDDA